MTVGVATAAALTGCSAAARRLLGGCAAEPATTGASTPTAAPAAVVAVRISDALGLSVDAHAHRRVLAVLRYLSDA
jgi:hypothetical protein